MIRGFGSLRARGSCRERIIPNSRSRSCQIVPDPARSCQIVPDPKYRLGLPGSSRTLQDLPGTLQIDDFGHPENHQKIDASNFCILKQVLMISARFLIILSYFRSILGLPWSSVSDVFVQVPILLCFETNFPQISENLKM